jgi:hypothetical protein
MIWSMFGPGDPATRNTTPTNSHQVPMLIVSPPSPPP